MQMREQTIFVGDGEKSQMLHKNKHFKVAFHQGLHHLLRQKQFIFKLRDFNLWAKYNGLSHIFCIIKLFGHCIGGNFNIHIRA